MTSTSWFFANGTEPRPSAGELMRDHRARIALEERERAEGRRLEMAEQRSNLNAPDVRIRAWEKMHGLRMPSDAKHPILDVIAIDTCLTLADVEGGAARAVGPACRTSPETRCGRGLESLKRKGAGGAPKVQRWQAQWDKVPAAREFPPCLPLALAPLPARPSRPKTATSEFRDREAVTLPASSPTSTLLRVL